MLYSRIFLAYRRTLDSADALSKLRVSQNARNAMQRMQGQLPPGDADASAGAGEITLRQAWERYRTAHLIPKVAVIVRSRAIAITSSGFLWDGSTHPSRNSGWIPPKWQRNTTIPAKSMDPISRTGACEHCAPSTITSERQTNRCRPTIRRTGSIGIAKCVATRGWASTI